MIRHNVVGLLASVGTLGFAGLLVGCGHAAVEVPVVAPPPPPVAVVEPPPPGPPALVAPCDSTIKPSGHIHFPHEVEFDTGKASLKNTPVTNGILQCLADFLKNTPNVTKFSVRGHTDNQGDPNANQALSQQRADAVVAWLVSHGVDGNRLFAQGFGANRPLVPNDSPEHMAMNRRVEWHLDQWTGHELKEPEIDVLLKPTVVAAPVVAAPAVGVAVPTVGVAVPSVGISAPSVAVTAPSVGVAVPTGVSVGVGVGAPAAGGSAPAKKEDDKKKK